MDATMMHSPIWTRVRAAVVVLGWLALLTPSILCGCAPQRQWARNGVTQTAFDQDAARCRRKAAKATYREPFAYASGQEQGLEQSVAQEKIFEQCMFAQGYRLEEKPSSR